MEELAPKEVKPAKLPLEILYEDDAIIVVNKPAGLVVHPTLSQTVGRSPTGPTWSDNRVSLVAALLYHCGGKLSDLGDPLRRGVVHRLDRDTSGALIAAKTNEAHNDLTEQFRERRIHKKYVAVVRGEVEQDSGEITLPIGRDSRRHDKKVVKLVGGRPAISRYEVKERFRGFTLVELFPRTGRTHQLRVHMSAIGHPVVADAMYGGGGAVTCAQLTEETVREENAKRQTRNAKQTANAKRETKKKERPIIARQALHAMEITFAHPVTHKEMTLVAPLPEDIRALIEALKG
jgi:23S rRNA pseudouridine1911/1915/1917 synthase